MCINTTAGIVRRASPSLLGAFGPNGIGRNGIGRNGIGRTATVIDPNAGDQPQDVQNANGIGRSIIEAQNGIGRSDKSNGIGRVLQAKNGIGRSNGSGIACRISTCAAATLGHPSAGDLRLNQGLV
jgi:hypothetical protein